MATIVIKPGIGVDSANRSGPRLHEFTHVNLEKFKFFFEVLIFYMKKLKNNLCEYRLYML
jgi:hypothetical protein